MIKYVVIAIVSYIIFKIGYFVGQTDLSKRIRADIDRFQKISEELKERNNQFLRNILDMYTKIEGTDGVVNELDIYLMDKWID